MAREFGKLAQRYAKALFNSTVQSLGREGRPTPAQNAAAVFSQFARIWREDQELSGTILNPMFDRGERLRALLRLAEQAGLPDVIRRGLSVIFENDRIAALPEIARAFCELADSDAGLVGVEITVARSVAGDEMEAIESNLRQQIRGDLRFSWTVDPLLLGGMIVRYEGKVVDGSLNSRLEQIESKLKG